MRLTKKVITLSSFFMTTCYLSSAVVIDFNYVDIGAGGVGGSGLTVAQQTIFEDAANVWTTALTGYQDGVTGPESIVIDASAPGLDGVGGVLGQANVGSTVTSAGFVLSSGGFMEFDSADLADLEASGELSAVILHEMAHVLGIGILWIPNGLHTEGSKEYTGTNALTFYQRDFDPDATFVPVEQETGSAGSDGGHWNEQQNDDPAGTGLLSINPDTSYFGESFDDELLTSFLSGSAFISDVTLGSFIDMGYTVELDVPNVFVWDAGNNSANGSIESGDGVWDLTTSNWSSDDGATNSTFFNGSRAEFTDQGADVTISGTVEPAQIVFDVDGYVLSGGTLDRDGNITITVTNAADTATFDTTIAGTDSLILDGAGTVVNLGNISRAVSLDGGALTNSGSGVISGDVNVAIATTFSSDGDGLADTITLTNLGNVDVTGAETINSYIATGGMLTGGSTLTATTYTLSDGAIVDANLGTGTVSVTSGSVTLNGNSAASDVIIDSGVNLITAANSFTATPSVLNAGTLVIGGDTAVASYDATSGGSLDGNGIFTTSSYSGGTIVTQATGVSQLSLLVDANGGDVTLGAGSTLQFSVASDTDLGSFNVYPLFSNANQIIGDDTSIGFESFNLSGVAAGAQGVFETSSGLLYIFDLNSGTDSSTENTQSVVDGLVDGVLTENQSFSNIDEISADSTAIIVLAETLANADSEDEVTFQSQLQELSPEVYGGVADYSIRSHLNLLESVQNNNVNVVRSGEFRFLAGVTTYNADTSSSIDNADYDITASGGYFGVIRKMTASTHVGLMIAADEGDVTSRLLDLDGSGTMFGIFTETEMNMPFYRGVQWGVLKTSLSFSDFSHDGTRFAQGLESTIDDISTGVIQAGIQYKAELFNGDRHKIAPFISANYMRSTTDSFQETGAINSLNIDEFTKQLIIVDAGVDGSWRPVSDKWGFTGMVKAQYNFGDDATDISATFEGNASSFSVSSPGLSGLSIETRAGVFMEVAKGTTLRLSAYKVMGDDYENSTGANVHCSVEW